MAAAKGRQQRTAMLQFNRLLAKGVKRSDVAGFLQWGRFDDDRLIEPTADETQLLNETYGGGQDGP